MTTIVKHGPGGIIHETGDSKARRAAFLLELRKHLQLASKMVYRAGAQDQGCIHLQHPLILGLLFDQSRHLSPVAQIELNHE